ncbi:MAG: hypothetical protein KAX49_19155, partial [Halanaerobiales bacterium]|nr:hypothetical protein [Halanaerobiales bacterium]
LVIDSTAGTSFDYSGGSIKNGGDLKFALADTLTGVVFDACAEIDTNGATFNIVTIGNTTETVTGSLLVNTQVEGESCTNMKFNTYGANYAIYVAATVTTFDMDNWIFDDTNNTTGYALYWLGTTGTLTVNALNGTNLVTAGCLANTGGAVEVVANPVAITLTVTDIGTTLPINGARALVAVANGDNFPFEETVTATSSSLTATVAHTAHGYSTGQKVLILGANEQAYNGVQLITVTGVDAYTFTLLETTTTPATGTLNATTVLIDGTTNASGIISDTRSYGANQLIQGRVRMSTSSPYYKTSPLTGTIDSTNGLGIAVQMIRDE